jgi:hypothetical protein
MKVIWRIEYSINITAQNRKSDSCIYSNTLYTSMRSACPRIRIFYLQSFSKLTKPTKSRYILCSLRSLSLFYIWWERTDISNYQVKHRSHIEMVSKNKAIVLLLWVEILFVQWWTMAGHDVQQNPLLVCSNAFSFLLFLLFDEIFCHN